jgi:putative ABC transport system substrate-binding protein
MSGKIFVWLLTTVLLGTVLARAQQPTKIPRVGVLRPDSPPDANFEAFRQGLRELGYVEGQNIIIELRYAERKPNRLRELADELVRLKVDVIVTPGAPPTLIAKQATSTIPIVFANVGDPVGTGLVASLSHPGGNITGMTSISPTLIGKRLELIKETVSNLSRIAVFADSTDPGYTEALRETRSAARALGLEIQLLDMRAPEDFNAAFQAAVQERSQALIVLRSSLAVSQRKQIAALAIESRLPAVYDAAEFAEAGGLMSYGTNQPGLHHRAAVFVDRILKGAKPADLPVEQPTKFEFVINLKAAKQIGLTVPPNVLARADKVIR